MGNHFRQVNLQEKIKCAEQRKKELDLLINNWRQQSEDERTIIAGVEGPTSGIE